MNLTIEGQSINCSDELVTKILHEFQINNALTFQLASKIVQNNPDLIRLVKTPSIELINEAVNRALQEDYKNTLATEYMLSWLLQKQDVTRIDQEAVCRLFIKCCNAGSMSFNVLNLFFDKISKETLKKYSGFLMCVNSALVRIRAQSLHDGSAEMFQAKFHSNSKDVKELIELVRNIAEPTAAMIKALLQKCYGPNMGRVTDVLATVVRRESLYNACIGTITHSYLAKRILNDSTRKYIGKGMSNWEKYGVGREELIKLLHPDLLLKRYKDTWGITKRIIAETLCFFNKEKKLTEEHLKICAELKISV